VRQEARFYVYVLTYPDETVFYVGKGQGNRINEHEYQAKHGVASYKCNVIRQIWRDGGKVVKVKIQENMLESEAYRLEIDLIAMYGREHLTNMTDGGEGGPISSTVEEVPKNIARTSSAYTLLHQTIQFTKMLAQHDKRTVGTYLDVLIEREARKHLPAAVVEAIIADGRAKEAERRAVAEQAD
jgi:hypothetical protein